MGVYDIFGKKNIQIKVGCPEMNHYKLGDKVTLPDGVYLGYEGVVVIKYGMFQCEFPYIITKWGEFLKPEQILDERNPVNIALEQLEKTYKEKCQKKKLFTFLIQKVCEEVNSIEEAEKDTEERIRELNETVGDFREDTKEAYIFLNDLQREKVMLYQTLSELQEELKSV